LRIANPSPPSGWVEDFHLQATEHARHTTSPRVAEAFGVREDTVRLWRSEFVNGGIEALKASVAPGPAPVKTEAALRVVTPLLEAPVADRPNWTIPRLITEIEAREGVRIGRSQLSKALRKKTSAGDGPGTR
jgi:transposase